MQGMLLSWVPHCWKREMLPVITQLCNFVIFHNANAFVIKLDIKSSFKLFVMFYYHISYTCKCKLHFISHQTMFSVHVFFLTLLYLVLLKTSSSLKYWYLLGVRETIIWDICSTGGGFKESYYFCKYSENR